MAKDKRAKTFMLTTYYKIVLALILIVGLLYAAVRIAAENGYKLIDTTIQYWIWYALVIGVILLVGRFATSLPKNPTTQKSVKICVAIVSVITIFLTFINCVTRIDSDLKKYAVVESDDGKHQVILMRADVEGVATETEPAAQYTFYAAYRKINKYFCDSSGADDLIVLTNEPDVSIKKEWSDDMLVLYVADRRDDPDYCLEIPLK